jgi:oligopeptide/dipeptide ABC transporter ATP-binding protein
MGLAIAGLLGPSRSVTGGRIAISGETIVEPGVDRTGPLRGWRVGFVPQDPFAALDPLRRVGAQLARPLQLHRGWSRAKAMSRVVELVGAVGIADPEAAVTKFPHELSGGQLQRAVIASSLSCEPALLIADEPTSALDVIVQSQVLDAFLRLAEEVGAAVLLVTHDFGVVAETTSRTAAMYAGKIVEFGSTRDIMLGPRHPYVEGLLRSLPSLASDGGRLRAIPGQPPALPGVLDACAFAPRCPYADELCRTVEPLYEWPAESGFACHHPVTGGVA